MKLTTTYKKWTLTLTDAVIGATLTPAAEANVRIGLVGSGVFSQIVTGGGSSDLSPSSPGLGGGALLEIPLGKSRYDIYRVLG